ncbi:unnamed protein product [Linum trigynum]|uniref:Uncharacterized protein n=1 Tax=Linum trigynum TaxID=586398 RepID=A0AAV2FB94_9ROSI
MAQRFEVAPRYFHSRFTSINMPFTSGALSRMGFVTTHVPIDEHYDDAEAQGDDQVIPPPPPPHDDANHYTT